MNRMKITATMLIVFAFLAMAFASAPGAVADQGSFVPYAAASGENLTIFANGTVSNSSLVTVSGNQYTLTGSLAGNLFVNASNIVVSGNGYSVNGHLGIQVVNVSDVTLTDFGVKEGTNSSYLTVASAGNIVLTDSNILKQSGGYVYSNISYAGNVSLTGNTMTLAEFYILNVNNVLLSNNIMDGDGVGIYVAKHVNITSNAFNLILPAFNIEQATSVLFENNVANTAYATAFNNNFLYIYLVNTVTMLNDNMSLLSNIGAYGLYVEYVNTLDINNVTAVGFSSNYNSNVATISVMDSTFSNMTGYDGFTDYYGQSLTVSHSTIAHVSSVTADYYQGLNVYQVINVSVTNSVLVGGNAADLETITHLTLANSTITTTSLAYIGIYTFEITHGTIYNNTVYWTADYNGQAIHIDEFSNVNVSHNTVYSMVPAGGSYSDGFYGSYLMASSFTDNRIVSYNGTSNFSIGIYLYDSNNVMVSGNTANAANTAMEDIGGVNNTMVNNVLGGVEYGIRVTNSLNFNISQNADNGSLFAIYSESNVNGLFWMNSLSGVGGYGIQSYGSSGVSYIGNTFTGMGLTSYAGAVLFSSLGGNLVSNTFTGFFLGFGSAYSSGLSVVNNQFQGGSVAIVLANSSSLSITGNTFAYYSSLLNFAGNISMVSVYHNNFVNYSQVMQMQNLTNGTILHAFVFDMGATVGGNFWTDYSGPYSNGIGTAAYSLGFGLADNHPLQNPWADPVITFVATGLVAHTQWSVTVNSRTYTTSGSSMNVPVVNGAYGAVYYSVGSVAGFSRKATSGTVYYSGSSVTAFVNFVQVKYGVTLSTSGLPANTTVSVNIGNAIYSVNGSLTVNLPNGTYTYTVTSPADFTTSKSTGTFTVSGGTLSVTIPFRTTGYTVTFRETGLSGSFTWSVTVNGKTYTGNGTTISVPAQQPGNYNYTVKGPSGYSYSGTGSISVSENSTVLVLFSHGISGGLLAVAIVGSLAAGLIAMLLLALFAPQAIDSLRNRVRGTGNKNAGGKESGSKAEQKPKAKPKPDPKEDSTEGSEEGKK